MASLKVICPKCLKGQQVVVDIPAGGLDHVCLLCKTSFRVRPPARSSSDDLPASRESVPRPSDLPASRDAVPRPADLPAPRESVPRPSDLPVDRNAVPRPSDLPVDRNAVPRPGDLPIDRNAVPRPGDLPIDRDAVPRPGDLPIDRNTAPAPIAPPRMPPPLRSPVPPTTVRERTPAKTPPLGLSLDLSLPPIPEPPAAGGESLTLGDPLADAHGARQHGQSHLNLGRPPAPPAPPAPSLSAKAPPPVPKGPPRFDAKPLETRQPPVNTPKPPTIPTGHDPTLPSLHALGGAPAAAAPPEVPPARPGEVRPVAQHKPFLAPLVPDPSDGPARLDLPDRAAGNASSEKPPSSTAPTGASSENLDLGFSLEFASSPRTASGSSPLAIPFPAARVASEGLAEAAAEGIADIPHLAPPAVHGASAARAMRPMARRGGPPRWVFFAGGAAIVVVAAVAIAVPLMRSAPNPDNVIKPFGPELAKDNLVAYQNAASELGKIAANFKDSGAKLRLKSAELLLVANAAHGGGPGDATVGEQAVASAASHPKLAPVTSRVRALVALANGKPGEVDKLLSERATPESQLILGLARIAEDKMPAAVAPLRAFVAARPADLLGHYLLGRALRGGTEARKEFELVLAKNPEHAGAQVGMARLEETPEKRMAASRALADKKLPGAGPTELAMLQLLIGQSSQTLGHTPEAIDAFNKAITHDKRFTAAYLALGESLLYDGKYGPALERLKAAGPTLEASAAGKFALGGAYIANNDPKKGLALVAAATKEQPEDARGPFWTGFASTAKQPPDFSASELGFRDALKKDPKFLPASLKLATILQQQNKAEESLAVLRAAEEAGAPPSVLQLAWGEALIVAKEPGKAEEVFQKALETDPKSVPARLGVAGALEAQGKIEEAKVSLELTLKASPESLGLRERLAQVCLKLDQKPEALAHYQAEIQAGHPTVTIRLAVARLALDLGKVELAQSETKKVFDVAPRNAEAAYYMARVHEAHNSNGLALTEYRHATTWGNTPLFALGYGRLLDKLGKQHEALASFANAISLPEGRMERGRILFRAGDIDNALADFEAASKMTPKDAEPLILQGLCYDKLGQATKADDAYRAALKIDPDAPEPHYRLGRTEMDRAKPATAIEHFRKAMAKAPDKTPWLADMCFQLAQAELLTGAKAAALADFKKYLEISPPNAPARPEAAHQVTRLGGAGSSSGPSELHGSGKK